MMPNKDDINVYSCPLHNQTGSDAIKNFDKIIAQLSPEQRAIFEAERANQEANYRSYLLLHGHQT